MRDKLRLTPSDWTDAAFRALATGGVSAIRIEHLARDLGATKGSFYWHYKDLQALFDEMLIRWVSLSTAQSISAVTAKRLSPAASLEALIEEISVTPDATYGGGAIEPAIREWARFDNKVRDKVAQVDLLRIDYVAGLLKLSGLPTPDAEQQAKTFYAIVVGVEHLQLITPTDMAETLRAFLLRVVPPRDDV